VTDQGVVVLGLSIPSSSPLFLSIVAIHVLAELICTVTGIVAMVTPKRAGRHSSAGTVYYWSLVVVFLTMTALSLLRWPANTHLFVLGIDWRARGRPTEGHQQSLRGFPLGIAPVLVSPARRKPCPLRQPPKRLRRVAISLPCLL
jgi:hypothetical protein